MGDWIPLPGAYSDQNILPIDTFQAMWNNLYTLKDKEVETLLTPASNSTIWSTTSTTFVPIDSTYYRATFESFGGDLLLIANLSLNSASDRAVRVDFRLDGARLGNTFGLLYWLNSGANGAESHQLIYYASPVAAGAHELVTEFSTADALFAAQIFDNANRGLWIVELM